MESLWQSVSGLKKFREQGEECGGGVAGEKGNKMGMESLSS